MAERDKSAVLLLAHGTPKTLDDIPTYLRNVVSGRPMPDSVVEEIRHRYSLIGRSPLRKCAGKFAPSNRGRPRTRFLIVSESRRRES